MQGYTAYPGPVRAEKTALRITQRADKTALPPLFRRASQIGAHEVRLKASDTYAR